MASDMTPADHVAPGTRRAVEDFVLDRRDDGDPGRGLMYGIVGGFGLWVLMWAIGAALGWW